MNGFVMHIQSTFKSE